jgi:predicted acyltransferase
VISDVIADAPQRRLDALDVFRGLTIAGMILVSTPGTWSAVYTPLDHAAWNGWTPTDLVFPFLLFAMGAAVPFALARRRRVPQLVRRHVIRRAAILFALGLLLNAIEGAPAIAWATFRIPGVLQRIALVYLAVAWLTERVSLRGQIAVAVSALVGYWAAMTLVPVPGVGAGVLTPAGNLASYVDRAILGGHMLNRVWDPEGLLSTVPAVVTALCGVFAGDWLKERGQRHRSGWLWAAGLALMLAGLAWGVWFPLNKNLWTSSFALFSAGLAAQIPLTH